MALAVWQTPNFFVWASNTCCSTVHQKLNLAKLCFSKRYERLKFEKSIRGVNSDSAVSVTKLSETLTQWCHRMGGGVWGKKLPISCKTVPLNIIKYVNGQSWAIFSTSVLFLFYSDNLHLVLIYSRRSKYNQKFQKNAVFFFVYTFAKGISKEKKFRNLTPFCRYLGLIWPQKRSSLS